MPMDKDNDKARKKGTHSVDEPYAEGGSGGTDEPFAEGGVCDAKVPYAEDGTGSMAEPYTKDGTGDTEEPFTETGASGTERETSNFIVDMAEYGFLLAVNDSISAEVYENMLTAHGISVVKKHHGPYVQSFIQVDYEKIGLNIFVPKSKLAHAHELVQKFDSEPYTYGIPIEEYQIRLKRKPPVLGFVLLLFLFGMPVLLAIVVIIYHLFLK